MRVQGDPNGEVDLDLVVVVIVMATVPERVRHGQANGDGVQVVVVRRWIGWTMTPDGIGAMLVVVRRRWIG